MKKLISFQTAARVSITIYILFVIFHICVIAGLIPQDIVWGGRFENSNELVRFEILSITILLIAMFFTLVRMGLLPLLRLKGVAQVVMWILFALFLLNTLGNLMAQSSFEKYFAILTLILSLLSLRLALGKG